MLGFEAKKIAMADYNEPVLRTWAMTEKKLDANAKAILAISAFLAPDDIPNSLLMNQSNIVLEISDILEQKKQIEFKNEVKSKGDQRAIRNALAQLNSYSMINSNISDESFSIHRLVQEVARLRLSKENIDLFTQLILTMIHKDSPLPEKIIETNFLWHKAMDRHISGIIAFANRLWPDVSSIPKNIAGSLATQINNLELYYKYYARFSEAEILITRALDIDEKAFGKEHPNVARDLNNLAALYRDTNRLKEAEPLMLRVISILEKSLGKNHPNVATAMNNLAQLYKATNRLKEAEPLMLRVLEIDEKAFGKKHPDVARDLNNIAQLYQGTNRLKEAEPLMLRALDIDEKAFGKEHPNVARDLNNLALLYRVTNRLKEAEPIMKRSLLIIIQFTRHTGHPHPHLEAAINNFIGLLQQIGYSEEQVKERLKKLMPEMF